jgi:hypothetical protein
MTEQDLIKLGFERQEIEEDQDHYYTYNFTERTSLITNTAMESDTWSAELYDDPDIKFHTHEDLKAFIEVMNRII